MNWKLFSEWVERAKQKQKQSKWLIINCSVITKGGRGRGRSARVRCLRLFAGRAQVRLQDRKLIAFRVTWQCGYLLCFYLQHHIYCCYSVVVVAAVATAVWICLAPPFGQGLETAHSSRKRVKQLTPFLADQERGGRGRVGSRRGRPNELLLAEAQAFSFNRLPVTGIQVRQQSVINVKI